MLRALILISAFVGLTLLVYLGWPSPSPAERSGFEPDTATATQTHRSPPTTDAPRAPLGPFAISGTAVGRVVVEQDGKPIANALVVDGKFRVEGLPGALVRVHCVADPLAGESVEIDTRTRAAHGIVLRAWKGASLVIETAAPTVRARTGNWTGSGKELIAPAGLVDVTLVDANREVTYTVMAPGTHRLSLMPEHAATIVGNAGIADGHVMFQTQHSRVVALADKNGRYRVEGMQPGQIRAAFVISPDGTRVRDGQANAHVLYSGSTLHYDFPVQWGRLRGRIENGPARVTVADYAFDAVGDFELAVPVGGGRVRAVGKGTRQSFAQGVPYTVSAGCTTDIEIRMTSLAVVTGTVRRDGAPFAGAVVRAHSSGVGVLFGTSFEREYLGTCVSGADGRFSLEVSSATGAALVAHAPGLWSQPIEARTGCVLELSSSSSIAGVVLDSADRPVAGRAVTLLTESVSVLSDAQGRFRFSGIAPGAHSVALLLRDTFPGVEHSVLRRVEAGETVENVVVRSRSIEALAGVVVDKHGRAVPGVTVTASCQNRRLIHFNRIGYRSFGDPGGAATTNTRGEFRIAGLWGGEEKYDLWVSGRETLFGQTTARPVRVVLDTTGGRAMSGRIVDADGAPVERMQLGYSVADKDSRQLGSGVSTVVDGSFTIPVPEGATTLAFSSYARQFDAEDIPAVEPIELRLKETNVIRGRVTDGAGVGVAGILVEIAYEADPSPRFGWGTPRLNNGHFDWPIHGDEESRSRADGSFAIRNVVDKRFYVRARAHPGYADSAPTLVPNPLDAISVRVERAGFVAGFIRDEIGRGIEGIQVTTEKETWLTGKETVSQSDGRFRLAGLPPAGEVKIYVRSRFKTLSFLARELVVSVGSSDNDVVLVRGGFAFGVVLSPDGEPVDDIYVVLRSLDGSATYEDIVSNADTAFLIGPAPLGRYTLEIHPQYGRSLPLNLPKKLELRLPSPRLTLVTVPTRALRGTAPPGFSVLWVPDEPRWKRNEENFGHHDLDHMTVPKSGEFELASIREEVGSVYVFKPGDSRFALIRGVRPGEGPIEVSLTNGGSIRGNVGVPAQWPPILARSGGLRREVSSGSDGSFVLSGLPPGRWVVRYEGREWAYDVEAK